MNILLKNVAPEEIGYLSVALTMRSSELGQRLLTLQRTSSEKVYSAELKSIKRRLEEINAFSEMAEITQEDIKALGFEYHNRKHDFFSYWKNENDILLTHFFDRQLIILQFKKGHAIEERKFDCQYKWQLEEVLRRHNLITSKTTTNV